MDTNHDGLVGENEGCKFGVVMGETEDAARKSWSDMIRDIDMDQDGYISLIEWIDFYRKSLKDAPEDDVYNMLLHMRNKIIMRDELPNWTDFYAKTLTTAPTKAPTSQRQCKGSVVKTSSLESKGVTLTQFRWSDSVSLGWLLVRVIQLLFRCMNFGQPTIPCGTLESQSNSPETILSLPEGNV